MSDRALTALSWTVVAVLAAAGAYFAAIYEPSRGPDSSTSRTPGETGTSVTGRPSAVEVVRGLRRGQEARAAREVRATPRGGEDAPRPPDLLRLEHQRAAAEPVARRFFAAFARYELGRLDSLVKAELRRTATVSFARRLISEPPRVHRSGERPDAAELGDLRFVAGTARSGGLRSAALVGWVHRAGERTPLAIELERRADGWRVSGIGG